MFRRRTKPDSPGRRVPTPTGNSDRALRFGRGLAVVMTVALVALFGRVYQLQAHPDQRVAALVDSQNSTRGVEARRGAIYDRRGRLLASTRVARRLFMDPGLIEDREAFPNEVGFMIGYNPRRIAEAIEARPESRYIVLDQRLHPDQVEAMEELIAQTELRGLATEPVLVRDYTYGSLASQLIGFVGHDGNGLSGLELAYEDTLAADAGQLRYLRDASRRPLFLEEARYEPHADGEPIRLSIDITMQAILEGHLQRAVTDFNAAAGQAIVMDPYTGEILAMASFPTYEPTEFNTVDPELYRNRCVTDAFEPGSIFKPFVWAGLTQLGAAESAETIDCEMGVWHTDFRRRLRDSHPYGDLTWAGVLVKSSNIGIGKVAMREPIDELHRIVEAFGFGRVTGSNLPGEVAGLVRPLETWNEYSQTSIPMGQEIGVTPLQIVRAFTVFANGGVLVTPTAIAFDPSDPEPGLLRQRILRPDIADETRRVLREVMIDGTGRRAESPHYAIFGKTGTAQLPDFENGGYHQDRYVASFVGGAPFDDPRLVVGVFIHDPDRSIGHYGGTVAAPAGRFILEESLLYLGVAPDEPIPTPRPEYVFSQVAPLSSNP